MESCAKCGQPATAIHPQLGWLCGEHSKAWTSQPILCNQCPEEAIYHVRLTRLDRGGSLGEYVCRLHVRVPWRTKVVKVPWQPDDLADC